MVTLQGKSCVIHTWSLLGWGSHEEALYKCSAFAFIKNKSHTGTVQEYTHYALFKIKIMDSTIFTN